MSFVSSRAVVVLLFNLAYTSIRIIFCQFIVRTWKTLFAALLGCKIIVLAFLGAPCLTVHSLISTLLELYRICTALSSVSRNSACLTLCGSVCFPSLPSAYAIGFMVCFTQSLLYFKCSLSLYYRMILSSVPRNSIVLA